MVKLYMIGYYDVERRAACDVVENRSYFTDADEALAQVRDIVMDHLARNPAHRAAMAAQCAADFHKWVDDTYPDFEFYPTTKAHLNAFPGTYMTFVAEDDRCAWFMTVNL